MGIESTIDPENTDLGRRPQAGAGGVPRGHGAADGRHLRRQREPGQPARAGPGRQVAGRPGGRCADRVSLRPRGPGREGVDPARRQEGRDGQHQRGHPGQRADRRDLADLPEGRQLPRSRGRQREARAGGAAARGQRLHAPAAHHRAQFLHLHGRVHSRQGQRRQAGDQQRRRGLHARPGQGPGPPDRGNSRTSTPSWSRPCARRRSRSSRWSLHGSTARAGSAAISCPPTSPSFSPTTQ